MNKSLKKRLIVCFVGVLLTLCFHFFISEQIEFVTYTNGNLRIQDYACYIIIAKAFWFDGSGNIYKLAFQQQALSTYVGSHIYAVMPLGISPIALVVWFPFAYIARFSMSLSYTLWGVFSLWVLFFALWNVFQYAYQLKRIALLPITLSFITIFSWLILLSIYGGQTSVIAAGLLIHLIYIMHRTAAKAKTDNWLFIALLIFILAIKPPYIALSLGLLMIYGRWRETFYSLGVVIFVLVCITPILTADWILSYLHQLRIFSQKVVPDAYAWAFAPHTMNIFRSAFRNMIGDNIANLISAIVTCSVYTSIVGYSIFEKIRANSTDLLSPLKVTKEQLVVLLVASYLLFAPYAGGYEDILFLPIFITVLLCGDTPPLTSFKSLTLTCILFVILLHNIFSPDKPLWLFWILKTIILGSMVNFCRFPSKKKSEVNLLT